MSDIHSSLLYDAATNSLASDVSGDNCWTKMVTAGLAIGNASLFQKDLKAVENLIKLEYKLTAMPTPWRSAKSVAISALKLGVALTDENGSILGKSKVQTKINLTKEVNPISSYQKIKTAVGTINKYLEELTPAEMEDLKIMLEDVLSNAKFDV